MIKNSKSMVSRLRQRRIVERVSAGCLGILHCYVQILAHHAILARTVPQYAQL